MYVHVSMLQKLVHLLAWQIESVIRSTGRKVYDLLGQKKLDDATAELHVRL